MNNVELTQEEYGRFEWQMIVSGFGEENQKRLKSSTALVTRVGGLGGPTALYLALAGVGKLILAHGDLPELQHLNRMILANYSTVGKVSPALTAIENIKRLNPYVEIEAVAENVVESNVKQLVSKADIIMDCAPWFEERLLLNREAIRQNKPMVESAMYGIEGYLTNIFPGETPCLECIHLFNKNWQHPFPVIGAIPGMLGCMSAMEGIKILSGFGTPLKNTLLWLNGADMSFRKIKISKNPNCEICSKVVVPMEV